MPNSAQDGSAGEGWQAHGSRVPSFSGTSVFPLHILFDNRSILFKGILVSGWGEAQFNFCYHLALFNSTIHPVCTS